MTKYEFIEGLRSALAALPANEREEAIRYYSDYFDESGLSEWEVTSKLGSPTDVANTILRDFYTGSDKTWNAPYEPAPKPATEKFIPSWVAVVLGILTCPVWVPIFFGILGTILGLVVAVIAVMLSILFVVALFIGIGVSMIFGGISSLFISPPFAIAGMGTGAMLAAAGTLMAIPTVWAFSLIPKLFKLVINAFGKMFSFIGGFIA